MNSVSFGGNRAGVLRCTTEAIRRLFTNHHVGAKFRIDIPRITCKFRRTGEEETGCSLFPAAKSTPNHPILWREPLNWHTRQKILLFINACNGGSKRTVFSSSLAPLRLVWLRIYRWNQTSWERNTRHLWYQWMWTGNAAIQPAGDKIQFIKGTAPKFYWFKQPKCNLQWAQQQERQHQLVRSRSETFGLSVAVRQFQTRTSTMYDVKSYT